MPIPDVSPISGDGLSRMHAGGHFLYPDINIWEWAAGRCVVLEISLPHCLTHGEGCTRVGDS